MKSVKDKYQYSNQDAKTEYLIRTLSRTNKKDYENYVINAIWQRLNNINIEPVTQQFVKRQNGSYALIDLYFPQLNIAIECDEAHHKNNELKDAEREVDVEEALSSIDDSTKFEIMRVDASESIEVINKQVDEIVTKINEKYKYCGCPKWIIEDPVEAARRKKSISTADNYKFKTIYRDIRKLFGKKELENPRVRCTLNLGDDKMYWCPYIAIGKDGEEATNPKWKNELSENGECIKEHPTTEEGRKRRDKYLTPKKTREKDFLRYTFGHVSNTRGEKYLKFLGVFKFETYDEKNSIAVFKKIYDELDLSPYIV